MQSIKFDLRELQAFVTVSETASFRAAAKALHLSAPALSRRIERLEASLGARLLERTTRHVAPTPVGEDFLQQARAALAGLDEAVQRIHSRSQSSAGLVTIACVPSIANHMLPRALRSFADAMPEVRVHVIDENASQVLDAVARGQADFGLSFTGSQEPDLDFQALARERYVLAMPRAHPWARRTALPWAELAGQRLVSVSDRSSNRLLLDQVLAGLPDRPVVWYECNHVTGALALVEAGLGLAALPQLALPAGHAAVRGVPLVAPDLWRTLGLLQRRGRDLRPVAQALRQHLLRMLPTDRSG